jgi:integral membrane protein (TIGR01906 family)
MRRALAIAAAVLVAILVPPLLVTTALRIVANDWIVSFEYGHGGVPADRYGLTRAERSRLARVGLDSILPSSGGVRVLEEARLPDGTAAFDEREIAHMQDVRDVVGALFLGQILAAAALLVLSVALGHRHHRRRLLLRAWRAGGLVTLGLAAAIGVFMLVGWDRFFVDFHGLLFEGDSWRFSHTDTLLRLYPDEFWMGVAAWISGLTVLLAVAVAVGTTLLLRRLD